MARCGKRGRNAAIGTSPRPPHASARWCVSIHWHRAYPQAGLFWRLAERGNSTDDDLLAFFRHLANGDRQYVILPSTAHSQGFSKNRQLLWYVMQNFLAAPAPVAS